VIAVFVHVDTVDAPVAFAGVIVGEGAWVVVVVVVAAAAVVVADIGIEAEEMDEVAWLERH
jgi:hypothetical protein